MRFHESITAATLLHASFTAAQAVYADNQAPLEKDPEHIAQHFPDVDEIELLSPAFASPNTVPEGFSNGTAGPTDQTTMGELGFLLSLPLTRPREKDSRVTSC